MQNVSKIFVQLSFSDSHSEAVSVRLNDDSYERRPGSKDSQSVRTFVQNVTDVFQRRHSGYAAGV